MYGIFGTRDGFKWCDDVPCQNEIATAQRYSHIFNASLHIIPSSLCTNCCTATGVLKENK